MRNAQTIATARREEAHVSARALFGSLVAGDARERQLIGGLLTGLAQLMTHLRSDPAGYALAHHLYREAERLDRHQDRADPLHAVGYQAVQAATQNPQA